MAEKELKKMSTPELVEEINQARGKSAKQLRKERLSQIMVELTTVRKEQDALPNELLHFALWRLLPDAPDSDNDMNNFLQQEVAQYFIDQHPFILKGGYYESLDERRLLTIFKMSTQCSSLPNATRIGLGVLAEIFVRYGHLIGVPSEDLYQFIRQMIPSQQSSNFRDTALGVIATLVGDLSYIYA